MSFNLFRIFAIQNLRDNYNKFENDYHKYMNSQHVLYELILYQNLKKINILIFSFHGIHFILFKVAFPLSCTLKSVIYYRKQ